MHPAFIRGQVDYQARAVAMLPGTVQRHVRARHVAQVGVIRQGNHSPVAVANGWLRDTVRDLKTANIHRAFDEEAIRDHAANWSRTAGRIRDDSRRRGYVQSCGIEWPTGPGVTDAGARARVGDSLWWRRQLRKSWTRAAENAQREIGMIRRGREPYASDAAVSHRRDRKRKAREFLQACRLVNEAGDQLELFDVAQRSLANPAIRRGEFMARARGFEEVATSHGHVAEFVTVTTPSRFHAELERAGHNPAHQREVVRDAQAWLCKAWARARAKFKRLSLLLYGFRIAEPHHDATPHWHLLLFMPAAAVATVRHVLRAVFLADGGDEPGAAERRVTLESIDAAKGSAVGYVAKYVSKNIDGAGAIGEATDGETGGTVAESVRRVDAWASIHGIRQFQQIGGPPVGVYRELRRLREPVADWRIECARLKADAGDWSGFIRHNGGIEAGRLGAVQLAKEYTGEFNAYGELRGPQIFGVQCGLALEITRAHTWRLERKNESGAESGGSLICSDARSAFLSPLGPVSITVRATGEPAAWTNPNETSQAGP